MAFIERGEWTIMFEDDGPAFAVEGHSVKAYPELDRVEVVPASQLQGAVEEIAESMVPARLLDGVRVSMKTLQQQHAAAWQEVDRLHLQLRGAVEEIARLRGLLSQVSADLAEHGHARWSREVFDDAGLAREWGQ
jgi:hypothetical protein